MKTKNSSNFALAACLTDLSGHVPTEIQLTLAGTFKARDGRPEGIDGWVMMAENANLLIEQANAQQDRYTIDYDHQTLRAQENGKPAPAAGSFKVLEWREGVGLFATDVQWTPAATQYIQNQEYRYISPVFLYNQETGVIEKIIMAGLVNNPALDGMKDLAVLATKYFSQQQESTMADAAKIKELEAKVTDLEKQLADSKAACAAAEGKSKKAACSTENVDLSQYVPVAAFQESQKELAALSTKINQNEVDDLVKVGLSDGRITPALTDWAKGLNHAALSAFLDKATPIAGLSGTQTDGKAPEGSDKKGEKSATEVASTATAYQAQQAALGYQIDDIAAINHVMSEWVKNV